jgi:hypothetical protein
VNSNVIKTCDRYITHNGIKQSIFLKCYRPTIQYHIKKLSHFTLFKNNWTLTDYYHELAQLLDSTEIYLYLRKDDAGQEHKLLLAWVE